MVGVDEYSILNKSFIARKIAGSTADHESCNTRREIMRNPATKHLPLAGDPVGAESQGVCGHHDHTLSTIAEKKTVDESFPIHESLRASSLLIFSMT
jgi:hypothetical protein